MGYSGYGSAGTSAHQHSASAGDGGVLDSNITRTDGLSPNSMALFFGDSQ